MNFNRKLVPPIDSFFLFGPRSTGKSTWLKANFPRALQLDLLRNDIFFELSSSPRLFRDRILACDPEKTWIIVDEIQRIPSLLHDVHSLIESDRYKFALSGSSSRKLKRGQANLLAGRALVKHMFPLIFAEYGNSISLNEALSYGTLPRIVTHPDSRIEQLEAYVGTYLREEIREEALTRSIQAFSRFLEVAALMNGQVTNLSNIARDAGVPRQTVFTYFEILVDTLLGNWLPAWTPKAKVKEVSHPKFYFFDCGVVRAIQKLLHDRPTNQEMGFLFETFIFNELNAYMSYKNCGGELFYWRTSENIEIDFIWKRANRIVAIEIKSGARWKDEYNNGFKSFLSSKIKPNACYGVYCGEDTLKKEFGWIFPWQEFLKKLYLGEIIG
ncbi:MAG: ATP-binding protein [Gammaproteobacteria bacterium]|nr:ATP-binding protein [Gammaproteobacteria bacterium]